MAQIKYEISSKNSTAAGEVYIPPGRMIPAEVSCLADHIMDDRWIRVLIEATINDEQIPAFYIENTRRLQ